MSKYKITGITETLQRQRQRERERERERENKRERERERERESKRERERERERERASERERERERESNNNKADFPGGDEIRCRVDVEEESQIVLADHEEVADVIWRDVKSEGGGGVQEMEGMDRGDSEAWVTDMT